MLFLYNKHYVFINLGYTMLAPQVNLKWWFTIAGWIVSDLFIRYLSYLC